MMEIIERETGHRLTSIAINLSREEASELRDGLEQSLSEGMEHFHVSSADYSYDLEIRVLPEQG